MDNEKLWWPDLAMTLPDEWRQWTDDVTVLAIILSILLFNFLIRREQAKRRRIRLQTAMKSLTERVLALVEIHGATAVHAIWKPKGRVFNIDVRFPEGNVVLTCRFGAEDYAIASAALGARPEPEVFEHYEDRTEYAPPPQKASGKAWWQILGVTEDAAMSEIKSAYRKKARQSHPDLGGSTEMMAQVNSAMDEARQNMDAGT